MRLQDLPQELLARILTRIGTLKSILRAECTCWALRDAAMILRLGPCICDRTPLRGIDAWLASDRVRLRVTTLRISRRGPLNSLQSLPYLENLRMFSAAFCWLDHSVLSLIPSANLLSLHVHRLHPSTDDVLFPAFSTDILRHFSCLRRVEITFTPAWSIAYVRRLPPSIEIFKLRKIFAIAVFDTISARTQVLLDCAYLRQHPAQGPTFHPDLQVLAISSLLEIPELEVHRLRSLKALELSGDGDLRDVEFPTSLTFLSLSMGRWKVPDMRRHTVLKRLHAHMKHGFILDSSSALPDAVQELHTTTNSARVDLRAAF